MFDKKCNIKREKLDFRLIDDLAYHLSNDEDFCVDRFLALPNATKQKIKTLHKAHKKARKQTAEDVK